MPATLEIKSAVDDAVDEQVDSLLQIERDRENGLDADGQMALLVRREKLRSAREYVAKLTERIAAWPLEDRKRRWQTTKKRAEELLLNHELRVSNERAISRRERGKLIYKTCDPDRSAAYTRKQEEHRERMARAAEHLRDHPSESARAFVAKYLPKADDDGVIRKPFYPISEPEPAIAEETFVTAEPAPAVEPDQNVCPRITF